MKYSILTVLLVLFTSAFYRSQQIRFPDSFILGKQDFLKDQIFISTNLLVQNGFDVKKNPDVTENKKVISQFAENFNLEDISKIYFEIYADKVNQNEEGISIAVLEFKTIDKLKNNMKTVDEIGLFMPIYFVIDNYVIVIYSENRYLINKISNFYTERLGAKYYSPKK